MENQQAPCRDCGSKKYPEAIGESSRRLPVCAHCEAKIVDFIRPSPMDRMNRNGRTR